MYPYLLNNETFIIESYSFLFFLSWTIGGLLFYYYVKKPSAGEKAKVKLKAKKYNPATRKHEVFVEKKLPPHSK